MKKLFGALFASLLLLVTFDFSYGAPNGVGIGATASSTPALAANQTVATGQKGLYSFEVSADATLSAAAWWIMVFDATTAPADGPVTPKKCFAVAAGTTSFAAAFPMPVLFTTGITISASTTGCFTKTASPHAYISGDTQ